MSTESDADRMDEEDREAGRLWREVKELRRENERLQDHAANIGPRRLAQWVKCVEALKDENKRLAKALEGLLEPAEFGSMEQSPPGYWDDKIDSARAALKAAK